MPRYTVCVTKMVPLCWTVSVEAPDENEARMLAMSNPYGEYDEIETMAGLLGSSWCNGEFIDYEAAAMDDTDPRIDCVNVDHA